jgi:hypothetical protein
MKKIFLLIILLVSYVSAQENDKAQVIDFMGTIYDKVSKKPLQARIIFRDATGKEFITESHPKTGWYQLLIPSQDYYMVTISSPDILQKIERINLKSISIGDRQIFDFFATTIAPGLIIDSIQIFDPNSSVFRKNAIYLLDSYIEILKNNTGTKFSFICDIPDSTENSELGKGRIEALSNYMEKWKAEDIYNRIIIEGATFVINSGDLATAKKNNLIIIVKETVTMGK